MIDHFTATKLAKEYESLYKFSKTNYHELAGLNYLTQEQVINIEMFLNSLESNKLLNRLSEIKIISFQEKTVENILTGIEQSKKRPFPKVLYALGIRHVGETAAIQLATYFKTIDAIIDADEKDLEKAANIGKTTADSIKLYLNRTDNRGIINRLKAKGLKFYLTEDDILPISGVFAGKSIVVSGSFSTPNRRKEIEDLIIKQGGKNASNVTKKTSFIVGGENIGPNKLSLAKSLNIEIITEQEFFKRIE
jgi:DNA ligase (NAD+)